MTEHNNLERRTFMGSLAALSAGKVVGTTAATPQQDGDDSGDDVGTTSDHLSDYANRVGRINHQGLNQAITDWGNGVITRTELDQVRDAFATGERVVDKEVQELSDNVNSDTLLERNPDQTGGEAIVYRVTSSISVDAELRIEAGVNVEFTQGTRLSVSSGSIKAEGTGSDEVFMTATNARPGWYDGVMVNSSDLTNRMEHTLVEYAGRNLNGNVEVTEGSAVQLTNCTLRWGDSYGLSLNSGGTLLSASGENTYTSNVEGAAYTKTGNVHMLSGSSSYTGNDRDYVFVEAETARGEGPDSEMRSWDKLDVPWRMNGGHKVNDMELEIQGGASFEFTQEAQLRFNGNCRMTIEGYRQPEDEEEVVDPIAFTGTEERRGWWNGIYVQSADNENVMDNVAVRHAGNGLSGNLELATGLNDQAELVVKNCEFSSSGGFGLFGGAQDGVTLKETGANLYTDNADGPARVAGPTMKDLSSTSDFTGNDSDYVLVEPQNISGSGPDSQSITWDAINVPWRIDGELQVSNLELVVAPGGTYEFTEASRLQFNSDARLTLRGIDEEAEEGEQVQEITFTGTDEQRGWWDGIYVQTSNTDNVMEYVIVEYAGNNLNSNLDLATGLNDQAELTLKNCTFRESGGFGLYGGSQDGVRLKETTSNTYTSNTDGAARVAGPTMKDLSSTSDFTGNDSDYVLVDTQNVSGAGPESERITWDNINVPWRIDGELQVSNLELVVAPGGTYEFTEASRLQFNSDARLTLRGIDEEAEEEEQVQEITFTGTDEQRGWWDGIYVQTPNTDNVMEYVIVEYAGNNLNGNLELATGLNDQAELTLKNCTFRESGGFGLYGGSQDGVRLKETTSNTYTSNADGPARVSGPTMEFLSSTSDFTGNDSDYVLVDPVDISGSGPDSQSITWDAINVPWRIDGELRVDNAELVTEPGGTYEFTQGSIFYIDSNALVSIEGVEGEIVLFTGVENQRGWWDGIYLQSNNQNNSMEFTLIEYGGRNRSGNLTIATDLNDKGYLEINRCTFQESADYGLYAGSSGGDGVSLPNSGRNRYTANASGAASMEDENIHYLAADSDFTGNDTDIVEVRESGLDKGDLASGTDTATWDAINVPYEFEGSTTHQIQNVELVIEPGATLQFREQGQLQFTQDENTGITIEGTESNPITLTGTEEINGWWDGIYTSAESLLNTIDHAVIEYGGRGLAGNIEMGTKLNDNATLTLTNSTISHSGASGLFCDDEDLPENDGEILEVNDFFDNEGEDYAIDDD